MTEDERLVEEFLDRIPRDTQHRRAWLLELVGRVRKDERMAAMRKNRAAGVTHE